MNKKNKQKKLKNIEKTMKILEKYFSCTERTTLNKMRKSKKSKKKPNAFKILISCLLSLRTKDANTEKTSKKLFRVASAPQAIAKIPLKKLEKLIYSSGHYRKKARTLKYVSKYLLKNHKGKVPSTEQELLTIKGIGRKTSNIVLSFAYGKNVLPIDTHCHRIPNRLGWIKTKNPEQTEKALEILLPKKYWREFNGIFVLFGKTICLPVSPLCSKCPVRRYCKRIGVKRSR